MVLCGSLLGLLLANGFSNPSLQVSNLPAGLCSTIHMAKKEVRSQRSLSPMSGSGGESSGEGASENVSGSEEEKDRVSGVYQDDAGNEKGIRFWEGEGGGEGIRCMRQGGK